MADRPTQLLLDGLSRAAAEPDGLPLFAAKSSHGLFAATASGRAVAQRCKDDGLLRVVRTDTRNKTPLEICALTDKGMAYLLSQVSPRQILEDFIRALDARRSQADELLAAARRMQAGIDALKGSAEKVLGELQRHAAPAAATNGSANGSEAWPGAALSYLARRQEAGASEDCPLPELFRHARQTAPGLTIGQFHDGLRRLHEAAHLYLHPWTGPLYALPEPACALLVGHEIAYYASVRSSQ
jgi:hypothetical protein